MSILCRDDCWLQKRQIPVYAAALRAYVCAGYSAGCAFLVGNEANGLTEEAIRAANVTISIPMEGEIESLNAGVAASVLMYESYRQVRAYRAKCGG
ncbi:MAG: TrmH family RNA methyltransferase [Lachnospiraceae bacterium]